MVPGALQKKGKKKGTHTPKLHPQILLWVLPSEDCGALWWELGHASCPMAFTSDPDAHSHTQLRTFLALLPGDQLSGPGLQPRLEAEQLSGGFEWERQQNFV